MTRDFYDPTEEIDDILTKLVPVMTEEEIRTMLEARLKQAIQSYQDFLSKPDS